LEDMFRIGKTEIRLVKADLTEMDTAAIVNAANSTLLGGGGVDGAIHRKGGPQILQECKRIRETQWPEGLPTGKAVITSGGNLKAKWVIHTVGPIWSGGKEGEADLLRDSYLNSLELAVLRGLGSVAFPSISTGAYGYPIEEACSVALRAVEEFLVSKDGLGLVVFVLFSEHDLAVYRRLAPDVFR
jgi:O-acetyl-ADP-ribose deacetylase